MPVTIAVCQEKGGVGKSTSTVSMGGAWAKAGVRCLVIDLDPQASLTRGLLGSPETDALPIDSTGAALFGDAFVSSARLIVPTAFDGLSLLPASRALNPFNHPDPSNCGRRLFAVQSLVQGLQAFERILIDCPPNLYTLSWCAMAAADYVLTPLIADEYGAQALPFVAQAVECVRAKNPGLLQLGYLRTLYQKRSSLQVLYSEQLARDFPGMVLENVVPFAAQFKEAAAVHQPITHYKPRCAASKAMALIVDEIEARIARLQSAAAYKEVA